MRTTNETWKYYEVANLVNAVGGVRVRMSRICNSTCTRGMKAWYTHPYCTVVVPYGVLRRDDDDNRHPVIRVEQSKRISSRFRSNDNTVPTRFVIVWPSLKMIASGEIGIKSANEISFSLRSDHQLPKYKRSDRQRI